MRIKLLSLIFLFTYTFCEAQQTTLISAGSSWKYLDNGSNQGTSWYLNSFNDAAWFTGNTEFGYGDNDEATVVSYGSSSSNKYITTYFRKTFNVSNPSQFFSLDLQAVRDDGIIVYINGNEVWRNNMPSGAITNTTTASSTISFGGESSWNQTTISAAYLNPGSNLIAVEIHQDAGSSSDISFNLKLNGNLSAPTATVDRGPYLNIGTSSSMIVKWRTTQATDTKLYYGTSLGSINQVVSNPTFTTNHEVNVTGLSPSTIYYYTIGCSGLNFSIPSDSSYFKTSPPQGHAGNYKFWAIGDAGMGDNNQRDARNGFLNYTLNEHIDGWIWLGDNAYEGGKDNEYQNNVFSNNTYERELKRMVVWPAPGNHDYNNHIPFSPSPAYYDIFTLPTAAEAGGLASGTEKYYSYDYGNIHFVVLDSYDEDRNTTATMATWLTNDLASTTQQWIIAYWHHPPYTKGSHDSDNGNFLNGDLVEIRENIIPIIENGGVDLVLNGHSHSYERSYLLDGHYGNSGSLQSNMIIDGGSGSYPSSCPYQKQTEISNSHKGTVYTVCGCSGKLSSVSSGWPHPAMYNYTYTTLGSMLLEVNNNRLDAKFVTSTGTVSDAFTIVKNAGRSVTYNICPGENKTLKPSWPGTVQWFPLGIVSDSVVVNPMVSTTYYAYDSLSCITDTFLVNMLPNSNCITTNIYQTNMQNEIALYPNLISSTDATINIKYVSSLNINEINLFDVYGKKYNINVLKTLSDSTKQFSIENLIPGIYFVEIKFNNNKIVFKKITIID